MFLVGIFQWWYGSGLWDYARRSFVTVLRVADHFSVGLLLRTLFNPFRQISASYVDAPLPVKLRAFFDRLISRIIGAVVRTLVIFIGIIAIAIVVIFELIGVLAWLVLPVLPVVGFILWRLEVTL